MLSPQTFAAALLLMIFSLFCWGSWPNFMKAVPKWRLEYFYVDYTIGFLITGLVCAATLGSTSSLGIGFLSRLATAGRSEIILALIGGFVWNLGNVLLLTSIMIAGLAVAFPIALVPAMVLGVGMSYWTQPIGNGWLLAASVIVLVAAVYFNATAYRNIGDSSESAKPRGVGLALLSGVLIGIFPPFVSRAISGPAGLDPYGVSVCFMLGAALATAVAVPWLLAKPLIGEPGVLSGYRLGGRRWHVFGLLAGLVWCIGTFANFVSAKMVGMAISWGIGSGAPMVGALWGIILWREFAGSRRKAKVLIAVSMILYTAGVIAVATAYNRA